MRNDIQANQEAEPALWEAAFGDSIALRNGVAKEGIGWQAGRQAGRRSEGLSHLVSVAF